MKTIYTEKDLMVALTEQVTEVLAQGFMIKLDTYKPGDELAHVEMTNGTDEVTVLIKKTYDTYTTLFTVIKKVNGEEHNVLSLAQINRDCSSKELVLGEVEEVRQQIKKRQERLASQHMTRTRYEGSKHMSNNLVEYIRSHRGFGQVAKKNIIIERTKQGYNVYNKANSNSELYISF